MISNYLLAFQGICGLRGLYKFLVHRAKFQPILAAALGFRGLGREFGSRTSFAFWVSGLRV